MKRGHRLSQIGAGLALFLLFVVLASCESLAEKRVLLADALGLNINCPCDIGTQHCHKYSWCNYCRPGYVCHPH